MKSKVTSIRLNAEERAIIAQLEGTHEGAISTALRRALRAEAQRRGIVVTPNPAEARAPRQKAA